MKKIIVALVSLLILAVSVSTKAQQIPGESFSAVPSGPPDTTEIQNIKVEWPASSAVLTINYSASGTKEMKDMVYQVGGETYSCFNPSAITGTNTYVPVANAKSITNLSAWVSFAKDIRERFVRISPAVYVETKSFKFLGESIVLGQSGVSSTNYSKVFVLESGKHLLTFDSCSWVGNSLVRENAVNRLIKGIRGSEKFIGFTSDLKYFFSASKQSDGNFFIDPDAAKAIYQEKK